MVERVQGGEEEKGGKGEGREGKKKERGGKRKMHWSFASVSVGAFSFQKSQFFDRKNTIFSNSEIAQFYRNAQKKSLRNQTYLTLIFRILIFT